MKFKWSTAALFALFASVLLAQEAPQSLAPLTVQKIMRDPAWIGHSPQRPFWSADGQRLYFSWNPENAQSDSLYRVSKGGGVPEKVSRQERRSLPPRWGVSWSRCKTQMLYSRDGDLFLRHVKNGKETRLTETAARETSPVFSGDEEAVIYRRDNNLYSLPLSGGPLRQITFFTSGKGRAAHQKNNKKNAQEQYLGDESVALSTVLAERKTAREASHAAREAEKSPAPLEIALGGKRLRELQLSPDHRFVVFTTSKAAKGNRRTIVPSYVTESGYVEDLNAYAYVGAAQGRETLGVIDLARDTVYYATVANLPGITDVPAYRNTNDSTRTDEKPRAVNFGQPIWSENGEICALSIFAQDHKDRWIVRLRPESGQLETLDRQHDDAWIGGPGMGWWRGSLGFLPEGGGLWFQSEESGYSHLYALNLETGEKQALTSGSFEIYSPQISKDGRHWYFTANKVHPGVRHFYRMPIGGGKLRQITSLHGGHQAVLSPDEKTLAYRHSTANTPWELFIQKNRAGATPQKITASTSNAFASYAWRMPECITFKATDGQDVHARLYRPETQAESKPGVIFVHGAGYLQNAHQWWSSYFREYMFHNLLADQGYTVLDIDYRGSAGYGRNWRTGIYRHMGGLDLSDQVDGAAFLVDSCGVAPGHIGIYGGSYGGFITLMAMFTEPETFAAGAALRSVTDWAHYHHGYTSPILNTPVADSTAFRRSSPIYFAEGLQGALLMCHGMIDTNVHFQDIVRLSQRLIELGKTDWELAVYPLEAHGFREPSSWTDEYSRIFKLFETHLK